MVPFNKFEQFAEDLANGVHDLVGTDHTLKVFLTNTAPVAATHQTYGAGGGSQLDDLASGGGYTKGGEDSQNNGSETGGTVTVTAVDIVWTATTGFGPFRYAVLYNDTAAGDPLIGYWDYGAAVTLLAGETFTVDFGASILTIT